MKRGGEKITELLKQNRTELTSKDSSSCVKMLQGLYSDYLPHPRLYTNSLKTSQLFRQDRAYP